MSFWRTYLFDERVIFDSIISESGRSPVRTVNVVWNHRSISQNLMNFMNFSEFSWFSVFDRVWPCFDCVYPAVCTRLCVPGCVCTRRCVPGGVSWSTTMVRTVHPYPLPGYHPHPTTSPGLRLNRNLNGHHQFARLLLVSTSGSCVPPVWFYVYGSL